MPSFQSIPSVEIGEVWGYCRDHLRGTTPLAQEQIDCLQRDYLAPSKAHLKRLKKMRPLVLKPRPPIWGDASGRLAFGDAYHNSLEVKRMAMRAAHDRPLLPPTRKPEPVKYDFTRNATVPKSDEVFDHAYYVVEEARLAREFEQARNA